MNYYIILNVPTDADDVAIRRAFRALARRYHPDAGPGSSSKKFRQLVEAYETLIDPARRREYDLTIANRSISDRASRMRVPVEPITQPNRPGFRRASNTYVDFFRQSELDRLFEELRRSFESAFLYDFFSW